MAKENVMFFNHSNVTSGNVTIWGRVDPLVAAQSQAGNLTPVIKWSAWVLVKTPTLQTPSNPLAPEESKQAEMWLVSRRGNGCYQTQSQ